MTTPLTVVMYHYVRPLRLSRFPEINGLDLAAFREQISYLQRHYKIIRIEDVIAAVQAGDLLPPRSALLTFDDGYADHYRYVFPLLFDRGLQGSFYVPRATALGRDILDVNKIHFILAAVTNHRALAEQLDAMIEAARDRFDIVPTPELRREYHVANRFDRAEVNYIKRLLQHALPSDLRSELASKLFVCHVSADIMAFSEELYMSLDQMRLMARSGMHFGGHGDRHLWMSRASPEDRAREVGAAVELLDAIGVEGSLRTYCYPYGDYDAACIEELKDKGFTLAFTTQPELALPHADLCFKIPRLDTNDLPKMKDAAPNAWTERVLGRSH